MFASAEGSSSSGQSHSQQVDDFLASLTLDDDVAVDDAVERIKADLARDREQYMAHAQQLEQGIWVGEEAVCEEDDQDMALDGDGGHLTLQEQYDCEYIIYYKPCLFAHPRFADKYQYAASSRLPALAETLLERMMQFLAPVALCRTGVTCRSLKRVAERDGVWESHYCHASYIKMPSQCQAHFGNSRMTRKQLFLRMLGLSCLGCGNAEFGQIGLNDANARILKNVRGHFQATNIGLKRIPSVSSSMQLNEWRHS